MHHLHIRFLHPDVLLLFVFISDKLTHHYDTWANRQRRMNHLEQENREIKEEVARITALIESVIAAQNQPSSTFATPSQRTVISEVVSMLVPVIPSSQSASAMHTGFPWGMPHKFMLQRLLLCRNLARSCQFLLRLFILCLVLRKPFIILSRLSPVVYEKMDEMKDQFLELRK